MIAIAPALGIAVADGEFHEAEAVRIDSVVEAEGTFAIELAVWSSLFEATRLSIRHHTAICFL